MEKDEKRKLDRLLELTEENNRMLSRLYKAMQWRRFFSIIYWVVIIGVAVGAFYFLQPYINQFAGFYDRVSDSVESIQQAFGDDDTTEQTEETEQVQN